MIASSAFFVLDAILDWPVVLYDASWSQWGQMASSATNTGGQLQADSPWRTDISSRSDLVVYNFDPSPGPLFFTGTGVNDMSVVSDYTGASNRNFRVQIISTSTTTNDTFRWSKNGGGSWDATSVPISAATPTTLTEGIIISFATATGHTLNDRWDFVTMRPVELLTLDGNVCSWQQKLDGTYAYGPTGCTPLMPSSYAATANQIEEEDAAYFGAGGGGGGGPIAPGY